MIADGPKFKGLRRLVTPEEQDQKLKDIAQKYEQQFLREMVKAMRGTVQESGFIKSNMAEKIFRDELDTEYVNNWSKQGGVGFSDIIYKQLREKFGVQLGLDRPVDKPVGPLKMDERANLTGKILNQPQALQMKIQRENQLQAEALSAPWEGNYLGSHEINPGEYVLNLNHDNGLKSQLIFKGSLMPGLKPGKINAGEQIGVLSPEAKSLSWNIELDKSNQGLEAGSEKTVSE